MRGGSKMGVAETTLKSLGITQPPPFGPGMSSATPKAKP
jgi:hypothetical protein